MFPKVRMRRLRKENLRKFVSEVKLNLEQLVVPVFVDEKISEYKPITSMPDYYKVPLEKVEDEVGKCLEKGLKSFILFGVPKYKDDVGSSAFDREGVIQRALRRIKRNYDDVVLITDVCLCEYTVHGHCGIVKNGKILNDETLSILGKIAVSHAEAGADLVAPSGMMDGMVKAIRESLDSEGYQDVAIMSYSAKFASNFYSPFREAAESGYKFGNRKSYQMDFHNAREALREIELDVEEGADIVMIKPALAYLDIISKAKERFNLPIAAYNVSGEYSMIKAAIRNGWLSEEIIYEVLVAIKRAGADIIITYHAKEIAEKLSKI
ncbi:MAG: porphobilinogen synthase [Archaeoglobaceae archaeon]|nr:porphobilinogen synthase [Archaeoglobaceae archaeon]MCX8152607.1 porphobilinogen synthase [Archaeoglobaceae archaeon]MDW8014111.1 porphobilinogen synthase [Archaeoglobaceae archaeon]